MKKMPCIYSFAKTIHWSLGMYPDLMLMNRETARSRSWTAESR